MRLTAFTDISLRIVMRLAVARHEELMTTRAVAGLLAVPYAHAAKAVARLSELGLVEARRGRGGGLQLTEKGRRASVGAIVRALETAGDVVGCEDTPPCPLRAACRLRTALRQAQEAFYASLDGVTVASLVESPTGPALLSLTVPAVPGAPDPAQAAPAL
ncbi:RrF2 family transcriptional regulator [Nonomuraea rhodomycinica]|uniref:Rrf2 family transcriptional regulator n=1 Tax=Nonomuraea rhodomycinica TaxID=1712872 RepID=A0A7Y6M932_9ACTN|nr:Rrf2 family transcriptional regulator [Nonomuraea rhodomycinica]NUW39753.1 Rrf2 family transcriptional regulator [Nonomuraea rhodomycinica]